MFCSGGSRLLMSSAVVQQRKVCIDPQNSLSMSSSAVPSTVPEPCGAEGCCVSMSEGPSALALMIGHKQTNELHSRGGVRGVMHSLNSELNTGVALSSIAARQARYGVNKLPEAKQRALMEFIKEALDDRTMKILIAAATVSLFLGMTTPDPRTGRVDRSTGWIEGAAILVSVVIVTLVSALNNFEKQRQFAALSTAETVAPMIVVREGRVAEIPNEDVVVGDVVLVMAGMALSCDMLLVEGTGYTANESSVTGENDDVFKSPDADPFLISGTFIVDGCDGLAVVVAVGPHSFAGSIAMATRQDKKPTPLQEQLSEMADLIGKFGVAAAAFTFGILFLKELFVIFFMGQPFFAMKFFENLTTAVAIVVVAVPEGLPLSVTIALAYSMKQMLADKNLVRHLAACETMGGATCICTDKTGTLTNHDMRVVVLYADGETFNVPEHSSAPIDVNGSPGTPPNANRVQVLSKLADCIAFNYPTIYANKTAMALQQMSRQLALGTGYDATLGTAVIGKDHVRRFAFSSLRKRSSVVVVRNSDSSSINLTHYVVGAAELVFQKCSAHWNEGRRTPLSPEARNQYEQVIEKFSRSGYRTLCIAFADRPVQETTLPTAPPEEPLTVLGIVGIEEPLRPEVPGAILSCQGAGIRVRMVTGDSVATALNIAVRSGILRSEKESDDSYVVMDGASLRSLEDDVIIRDVLPRLAVLARATPLDKQRLVRLLHVDSNAVVAVTGDGTNDAPALKSASVGFAMNSGSDIAKQASDIVLLDDNFLGVVKAVIWGRNVRDNIRKFLQFQLTVNAVACSVAFLGAVMNNQNLSPLKPVQLLWLNLIMDTFAALALATELPNESSLLRRFPDPRAQSIITKDMIFVIVGQAAFQLLTQLLLLGFAHQLLDVPYFGDVHLTVTFNTFVLLQVVNFFNARLLHSETSIFSNLNKSVVMLYIVFLIFGLQVFIVQKGGRFMSTVPLTGNQWLMCFGISMLALPVGSALRRVLSKRTVQVSGRIAMLLAKITAKMESFTGAGAKREDKD